MAIFRKYMVFSVVRTVHEEHKRNVFLAFDILLHNVSLVIRFAGLKANGVAAQSVPFDEGEVMGEVQA